MSERAYGIVSSAIKNHLKVSGESQTVLAEKLGVDQSSVTNWVGGRRRIELDSVPALARTINVDASWLCRNHLAETYPVFAREIFKKGAVDVEVVDPLLNQIQELSPNTRRLIVELLAALSGVEVEIKKEMTVGADHLEELDPYPDALGTPAIHFQVRPATKTATKKKIAGDRLPSTPSRKSKKA